MDEILRLLPEILNIDFIRGIISNPRDKTGIIKIKVRPLEKKGKLFFQLESFTKTQAFHENLTVEDACRKIAGYMERFGQMQFETVREEGTVLVSKKGKVTVRRRRRQKEAGPADRSHNRKKRYIMEEGKPVPFLKDLGVMTEDGKIVRTKTDKFRQINRFLEFVEDILPRLERDRELTILDFGCGKLAEKYGYDKLTFLVGDIADYDGVDRVDMVVTLHACDTATDYALAKAVGWGAEVILSVPCCQHELNARFADGGGEKGGECMTDLAPVMDYGLLRERFAALATDGLRAKYLEREGYETQVLEFIDMEHTPKNILIRAVKTGRKNQRAAEEIKKCTEFLGAEPALGRLLDNKGEYQ